MKRVDRPVTVEWKVSSNDPEKISGRKVTKVLKAWPEATCRGLVKVERFYWLLKMESGKTIEVWQDEDGYAECSQVSD